jgi:DNA modification methylase
VIALAEKAIRLYSAPGEIVCDPFAGSGTVGVAAKRTGRAFIGAEISPRHHEDAALRIHSANKCPPARTSDAISPPMANSAE